MNEMELNWHSLLANSFLSTKFLNKEIYFLIGNKEIYRTLPNKRIQNESNLPK